jgi:hypothetical protein
MKKITRSFDVLAAITAVLQACAGKTLTTQCATPTLTPQNESGPAGHSITVTIATATLGANLRYTLDGTKPTSTPPGNGKLITAQSAPVPVVFGRTLKAIACKPGLTDSPVAVGTYPVSN